MTQMNSNNLRSQSNTRTDVLECVLTMVVFIIMMIAGMVIAVVDKANKRPVLPFTTHDTCTSSSVSLSPTYGNMLRRVSSPDITIGTV